MRPRPASPPELTFSSTRSTGSAPRLSGRRSSVTPPRPATAASPPLSPSSSPSRPTPPGGSTRRLFGGCARCWGREGSEAAAAPRHPRGRVLHRHRPVRQRPLGPLPARLDPPMTTPVEITDRTYHLTVQAPGGRVYSSNDDHSKAGRWHVTARRNAWKHDAWVEAMAAGIPPLGRIHVQVTIRLRNWRRADAHNYPGASSFKGLLDGLVAARVVADERADFTEVDKQKLARLEGGRRRIELFIRQVSQ